MERNPRIRSIVRMLYCGAVRVSECFADSPGIQSCTKASLRRLLIGIRRMGDVTICEVGGSSFHLVLNRPYKLIASQKSVDVPTVYVPSPQHGSHSHIGVLSGGRPWQYCVMIPASLRAAFVSHYFPLWIPKDPRETRARQRHTSAVKCTVNKKR